MLPATNEILHEIDTAAEARKAAIRAAASSYPTDGTVYYVAETGSDEADGKSPETAIRSLDAVNALELTEGDTVLFKRGDTFRGKLSAKGGVTYSAWGEGAKPILSGSPENCAKPECWTKLEGSENVWVYRTPLLDVGGIVFDNGKTAGFKIIPIWAGGHYRSRGDESVFDERRDLKHNLGFFSRINAAPMDSIPDLWHTTGYLYLRCDEGNPGEVFQSIELFTRGNNIAVAGDNVTIDNLCIMHCGCHGIGTGNRNRLTVRNCELGWIGGCLQGYANNDGRKPFRYGNGIEIYVSCKDFTVENCYIYQVYDAGVTHQFKGNAGERTVSMENVLYKDNLIENCIYSIEYFLEQDNNDEQFMKNILMTGNICRFCGYGWGSFYSRAAHIKGWDHRNIAENFVIENNIFDRSRSMLIHCGVQEEKHLPVMRGNTYINRADDPTRTLGRYCERGGSTFGHFTERVPYSDAEKFNAEVMHDESGKFYCVTEEPVFDGRWPSGEEK
ncbi:MAG: hypothetical protein IJ493_06405 [Clostridia bacterium]|nr:hypothetical protein [Clostridia bacterium]